MILALDTSGGELLACLLDQELSLVRGMVASGTRHQDRVLEVVAELLGEPGEVDLSAIAVARGPGSQTGLRVGLATAEGLAFARRLDLVPVSSLEVAAHRVDLEGTVVAAVSAGRSNVYAQLFLAQGSRRQPTGPRVLCAVAEAHERLGVAGSTPLAAEPAVMRALTASRSAPEGSARGGAEALAAATREGVGAGLLVAYYGLGGDYGE